MAEEQVEVEVLEGRDHMGPSGNIVGSGGTYTTSKRQADELVKRSLVKITRTVSAPEGGEEGAKSATTGTTEETERWVLKLSPSDYLTRFPEGPQAALAKKLVDAGRGDEVAGAPEAGTDTTTHATVGSPSSATNTTTGSTKTLSSTPEGESR